MQKFIYQLRVSRLAMLTEGAEPREEAILARHFAWLQRLTNEGRVLLAGRTSNNDADTFGLVLLLAASEPEATRLMAADPAVAEGVMKAELHPFRLALVSPAIIE